MKKTVKQSISKAAAIAAFSAVFMTAFSSCASINYYLGNDALSGSINATPQVIATASPQPFATVKPRTPDAQDLLFAYREAMDTSLLLLNDWSLPSGYSELSLITNSIERYKTKHSELKKVLNEASVAIKDAAKELYKGKSVSLTLAIDENYPSWQYIAAAFPSISTNKELFDILRPTLDITETDSSVTLKLQLMPMEIRELAVTRSSSDVNAYLDIRVTYAYVMAMFDSDGTASYSAPSFTFDTEFLSAASLPLAKPESISDSWGKGSSGMGRRASVELKGNAGDSVLCCKSGTVVAVGTDSAKGDYLIVLDESGFEYHYYCPANKQGNVFAAINAGDVLTAKQPLGVLGDSAKLELSLLSPDGVFINAFELLSQLIQ